MSLGRVEHLQVFECLVVVWPVTSDTTPRRLHTFDGQWASKSRNWKQIQPDRMWAKQSNTSLPSVLRATQGWRGTMIAFRNIFFMQWSSSGPLRCHCDLIFHHSPVSIGGWWGGGRMAHFEIHWSESSSYLSVSSSIVTISYSFQSQVRCMRTLRFVTDKLALGQASLPTYFGCPLCKFSFHQWPIFTFVHPLSTLYRVVQKSLETRCLIRERPCLAIPAPLCIVQILSVSRN